MDEKLAVLIETEKKLLSALLLKNGEAIPSVAEMLTPEDFYRPEHRLIYKALLDLSDKRGGVDVLLVEKALGDNLKKVTHAYLFGIPLLEYTNLRAMSYAKIVKDNSVYRQLVGIGNYLTHTAQNGELPIEELLAETEKKLTNATNSSYALSAVEDAKTFAIDCFNQITSTDTPSLGLSTGFRGVDIVTGGLKKSDLIILAARPSMGKTAFALNIMANVSKDNSVLLFSLEMGKRQLGERLFAADSRINSMKIQHRKYKDNELDRLITSCECLANRHFFIDDTAFVNLAKMKLKARKVKREQGLDLIIIDYLQLMQSEATWQGNRVQQVSELSRGLKILAKELDIPVIALSQLSRGVEVRADKRPMLSDLRESGSIEQDADIVMFLYRDEYYNRDVDEEEKQTAELIVAKNRNGVTGTIPLKFEKEYSLFSDVTIGG